MCASGREKERRTFGERSLDEGVLAWRELVALERAHGHRRRAAPDGGQRARGRAAGARRVRRIELGELAHDIRLVQVRAHPPQERDTILRAELLQKMPKQSISFVQKTRNPNTTDLQRAPIRLQPRVLAQHLRTRAARRVLVEALREKMAQKVGRIGGERRHVVLDDAEHDRHCRSRSPRTAGGL